MLAYFLRFLAFYSISTTKKSKSTNQPTRQILPRESGSQ